MGIVTLLLYWLFYCIELWFKGHHHQTPHAITWDHQNKTNKSKKLKHLHTSTHIIYQNVALNKLNIDSPSISKLNTEFGIIV